MTERGYQPCDQGWCDQSRHGYKGDADCAVGRPFLSPLLSRRSASAIDRPMKAARESHHPDNARGVSALAGRRLFVLGLVMSSLGALGACSSPPTGSNTRPSGVPPVPSLATTDLGPSEPPLIWVGGALVSVSSKRLRIREPVGSTVTLKRLAGDATSFYRVLGGRWVVLSASERIATGQPACVQTLMDGTNLLALRVFLGASCGPT